MPEAGPSVLRDCLEGGSINLRVIQGCSRGCLSVLGQFRGVTEVCTEAVCWRGASAFRVRERMLEDSS